jgi:hypothetical protein
MRLITPEVRLDFLCTVQDSRLTKLFPPKEYPTEPKAGRVMGVLSPIFTAYAEGDKDDFLDERRLWCPLLRGNVASGVGVDVIVPGATTPAKNCFFDAPAYVARFDTSRVSDGLFPVNANPNVNKAITIPSSTVKVIESSQTWQKSVTDHFPIFCIFEAF